MTVYRGYVVWDDENPESGEFSENEFAVEDENWVEVITRLAAAQGGGKLRYLSVKVAKE